MLSLHSTNDWLDQSMKNRYYFSTEQIVTDKLYIMQIRDAIASLVNSVETTKTREDYLAWRSTWRALYSKISDESRFAKQNRKASIVGYDISLTNIAHIYELRLMANRMLDLRQYSKELAAERYVPKVHVEA